MKRDRIFGLDVIRAAAIWCVVFAHLFASTKLKHLGFVGVELFFVLSGFLIGGILIQDFQRRGLGPGVIGRFWARRWLRTLPAYYFYLILYYLAWHWNVLPGDSPNAHYFLFLQNLAWPIPGFFEISWSLCVEEWFYLTFPLLLAVSGFILRGSRPLVAAIILVLFASAVMRHFAEFSEWDNGVRKQVMYRLDAIVYGVLIAYVHSVKSDWWERLSRGLIALGGMAVFVFGAALVMTNQIASVAIGFSLVPLGLALVIPWGYSLKPAKNAQINSLVIYSSLWSYSAYLAHMLVFFALEHLMQGPHNLFQHLMLRGLELFCIIVVSAFTYHTVEALGLAVRERFFVTRQSADVRVA